ncbi:MAG TPA: PadR family transcriptional regulator [Candidatus Lumbricidophila sp.]|nr:PadR family transcriptional regulator [Candidatus Lumbricidophila sp.]
MTPPLFAHGDLRLYLLALLDERPRHGYELIQALSDRFGGTYTPSAGTIYPRLAKLEDEGLVSKAADGRKTVYAITDAGRAEVAARRPELDQIETDVTDTVRRIADGVRAEVNDAMRSLRVELAAAAQSAKASAQQTYATGAPSPTTDSSRALHETDVLINEWRQSLRLELRQAARRGAVSPVAVETLRAGLNRVRAEVSATLEAPRA